MSKTGITVTFWLDGPGLLDYWLGGLVNIQRVGYTLSRGKSTWCTGCIRSADVEYGGRNLLRHTHPPRVDHQLT